jgi:hypothetical protein
MGCNSSAIASVESNVEGMKYFPPPSGAHEQEDSASDGARFQLSPETGEDSPTALMSDSKEHMDPVPADKTDLNETGDIDSKVGGLGAASENKDENEVKSTDDERTNDTLDTATAAVKSAALESNVRNTSREASPISEATFDGSSSASSVVVAETNREAGKGETLLVSPEVVISNLLAMRDTVESTGDQECIPVLNSSGCNPTEEVSHSMQSVDPLLLGGSVAPASDGGDLDAKVARSTDAPDGEASETFVAAEGRESETRTSTLAEIRSDTRNGADDAVRGETVVLSEVTAVSEVCSGRDVASDCHRSDNGVMPGATSERDDLFSSKASSGDSSAEVVDTADTATNDDQTGNPDREEPVISIEPYCDSRKDPVSKAVREPLRNVPCTSSDGWKPTKTATKDKSSALFTTPNGSATTDDPVPISPAGAANRQPLPMSPRPAGGDKKGPLTPTSLASPSRWSSPKSVERILLALSDELLVAPPKTSSSSPRKQVPPLPVVPPSSGSNENSVETAKKRATEKHRQEEPGSSRDGKGGSAALKKKKQHEPPSSEEDKKVEEEKKKEELSDIEKARRFAASILAETERRVPSSSASLSSTVPEPPSPSSQQQPWWKQKMTALMQSEQP